MQTVSKTVRRQAHKSDGTFVKEYVEIWIPETWNVGRLNKKGYFIVYRPDYPGYKFSGGFAFRYHVVWWLNKGEIPFKGQTLNHKNKIKSDDRYENLELLNHNQLLSLHHTKYKPTFICQHCSNKFSYPAYKARLKHPKYCSRKCYLERKCI